MARNRFAEMIRREFRPMFLLYTARLWPQIAHADRKADQNEVSRATGTTYSK